MAVFKMYYLLGLNHISGGYDHILFIAVLCAAYPYTQWKKVLVLITSFTAGHSITLVLATYKLINISSDISEFLIAVTIFISSLANILQKNVPDKKSTLMIRYGAALFFGLIHGLGFSNYLRGMLGMEQSLFLPLFSFNTGIESGQVLVVLLLFLVSAIIRKTFKISGNIWCRAVSVTGLIIAAVLLFNRFPWK